MKFVWIAIGVCLGLMLVVFCLFGGLYLMANYSAG